MKDFSGKLYGWPEAWRRMSSRSGLKRDMGNNVVEIVGSWDSESGVAAKTVVHEISLLEKKYGAGYLQCFVENETAFIVFGSGWFSENDAREFVKRLRRVNT